MSSSNQQAVLFATELWDSFDVVAKNSQQEIQFCKDLVKFFKKRMEIEEEYAKKLSKLAEASEYARPTFGSIASSWEALCNQTNQTANLHKEISHKLSEKTVNPSTVLIKELELKKKNATDEGQKLNTEKNKILESLEKSKREFEKSSREAESCDLQYKQKSTDPNAKPKDVQHLEKEREKKKQRATFCRTEYKRKVSETNSWLEEYYSSKMPKVMSDFEKLENIRIHMVKSNLKRYHQVLTDFPKPYVGLLENLQESILKIDQQQDLEEIVKNFKTGLQIPAPFVFEEYVQGHLQPPQGNALLNTFKGIRNRLHQNEETPSSSPSTSLVKPIEKKEEENVYGRSLSYLMEKQKESADPFEKGLEIPRILHELDSIIRKSPKSEGLFRVSASAHDSTEIREMINANNFNFPANYDVHVYCSALKYWLRTLPDPLIPDNFYELATNATDPSDRSKEIMQIYNSLPDINKKVINVVVSLIQDLLPHEQETRMDLSNYAMVFSPSLLRCTSSDPKEIMAAPEKEKSFVIALFTEIKTILPPNNSDPENSSGFHKAVIPNAPMNSREKIGFAEAPASPVLPEKPQRSRPLIGRHGHIGKKPNSEE